MHKPVKKYKSKPKVKATIAKVRVPKARASKNIPSSETTVLKIRKLVRFDAQAFLDTVGVGRFIGKYHAGEVVYLQGDPAEAVFYIQKSKVQVTVLSKQGREGVIAVLGPV